MKRKSGNTRARTLRSRAYDSDSLKPASRTKAAVICCGIALLFTVTAIAKKKPLTKTIQGEVLDGENNPIVGASVELTDVTTGKTLGIYSEVGRTLPFHQSEALGRVPGACDLQGPAVGRAPRQCARRGGCQGAEPCHSSVGIAVGMCRLEVEFPALIHLRLSESSEYSVFPSGLP